PSAILSPRMTTAHSASGVAQPSTSLSAWKDETDSLLRQIQGHGQSLTPSELLPLLSFHQRSRWQAGARIPAEAYLGLLSQLPNGNDCAFELVYGEFLLRQELGEQPVLQEYLDRFPQHEAKLRRQTELHRALKDSSSAATIGLQAPPDTSAEAAPT